MKFVNLLHFYQPHNQQADILDRIVNESYRPLVKGLLDNQRAKVVVNITGALTKSLVEHGYSDVVDGLRTLAERQQIEFTGSAMYHAFLPLLPETEIERQIKINMENNQRYLGQIYQPVGFFPPELGINQKVLNIIKNFGYDWVAAGEYAYAGEGLPDKKFYTDEVTGLKLLFRNKRVSTLMLSATIHQAPDLIKETQDINRGEGYWFTVMDAETFGHHRIGHEKFLFEVLNYQSLEPLRAIDLLSQPLTSESLHVRASTWSNQEQDFWLDQEKNSPTEAKSFILWKDPSNPIHQLQWKLTDLVIKTVNDYADKSQPSYQKAREALDFAIASDQFWWASAKPWWSLEMIEQGAFTLKDVLEILDPGSPATIEGLQIYRQILDQAFEWQRNGYIRDKHLQNSSTFMDAPLKDRTPPEWYNQLILEFEDEMNKSAANRDFEKAIKWRDALDKLKLGTDIYDVLHVVNELWSARNIPELKPFFAHEWSEISPFAKEYIQEFNTEERFNTAKEKSPYNKD
jgi:hypothetical protein